jgi:hypothetical protein
VTAAEDFVDLFGWYRVPTGPPGALVVSATDTSPGDLTGVACPTGHCHLGGAPISNRNAYGAGLAYVADP